MIVFDKVLVLSRCVILRNYNSKVYILGVIYVNSGISKARYVKKSKNILKNIINNT